MMRRNAKILYVVLMLVISVFLLGSSSHANPLLGKWTCNTQETMKNMDSTNLSDMEKQMYAQYLDSIELSVTKDKMILKKMNGKEVSKYEILEADDQEVVVRYTEEDERDNFNLLQKDKMSWTLNTDQGDVRCILERQD